MGALVGIQFLAFIFSTARAVRVRFVRPDDPGLKKSARSRWDSLVEAAPIVHGKSMLKATEIGCNIDEPNLQLFVSKTRVYVYRRNTPHPMQAFCLDLEMFTEPRGGAGHHRTAFIHYVGADPDCPVKHNDRGGTGTSLMYFTDELFKCFDQLQVQLIDLSKLQCPQKESQKYRIPIEVELPLFSTLTRGQTFYEKFRYKALPQPHGNTSDNRQELQQALYQLGFEELRDVHKVCGVQSREIWLQNRGRLLTAVSTGMLPSNLLPAGLHEDTLVAEVFEEFIASSHATKERAGDFFEWLWNTDCTKYEDILSKTLVFPCFQYSSRLLRQVGALPRLNGMMSKVYSDV